MEVLDVNTNVEKTIPKTKKCKKANWLSEEALKIAVKRMDKKAMVHIHNGVLLSH